MARYATAETLYECPLCTTRFAKRESKQVGTNPKKPMYECPQCKDSFVMPDKAFTTEGQEPIQVWGLQSQWSEADRERELNHVNIIAPFPISGIIRG